MTAWAGATLVVALVGTGCSGGEARPRPGSAPPLRTTVPRPSPVPLPPPTSPGPDDPSPLHVVLAGACWSSGISVIPGATFVHVSTQGSGGMRLLRFHEGAFDPGSSTWATHVTGVFPRKTFVRFDGPTSYDRFVGRFEGSSVRLEYAFGPCRDDPGSPVGFVCEGDPPAHVEPFPWLDGTTLVLGHFGGTHVRVHGGTATAPKVTLSAPVPPGESRSDTAVLANARGLVVYAELFVRLVHRAGPGAAPVVEGRRVWIETWSPTSGAVRVWRTVPAATFAPPQVAPGPDGTILVLVPGSKDLLGFDGTSLRRIATLPVPAEKVLEVALAPAGELWALTDRYVYTSPGELGDGVPVGEGVQLFRRAPGAPVFEEVPMPADAKLADGSGSRLTLVRDVPWLRGKASLHRREGSAWQEIRLPRALAGAKTRWVNGGDEAWLSVSASDDGNRDIVLTTAPVTAPAGCDQLDSLVGAPWVR